MATAAEAPKPMDFEQAWNSLAVGDVVKVSDGTPPPSTNTEGLPFRLWRSHNFVGELEEKIGDGWRQMRFRLHEDASPEEVEYLAYTIADGSPETFEKV